MLHQLHAKYSLKIRANPNTNKMHTIVGLVRKDQQKKQEAVKNKRKFSNRCQLIYSFRT